MRVGRKTKETRLLSIGWFQRWPLQPGTTWSIFSVAQSMNGEEPRVACDAPGRASSKEMWFGKAFLPSPFPDTVPSSASQTRTVFCGSLSHLRVHNPVLHRIEQQTSSIFCLHLKANAAMVCNFNLDINHKKKPSGSWIPDEADTGSTFWCIYSFYFCDEYLFCGSVWSSRKRGVADLSLAWACLVSVATAAWRSSLTRSWNLMVVICHITRPHGGHQVLQIKVHM